MLSKLDVRKWRKFRLKKEKKVSFLSRDKAQITGL